MHDLLHFSGYPKKVIVETADIKKGTFHSKEGNKRIILEAEYNENGDVLKKIFPEKIENYVYLEGKLICIHTANPDKTPITKEDYYYEGNALVKKTVVNSKGVITETETYHYSSNGQLEHRKSKFMTYEYLYDENGNIIEEKWHSDFTVTQIIRYKYINNLLVETQYLSGDEIPGRRIELKRNNQGFITEEIVFSASSLIVSHIKYEYGTTFKNNWLKRTKFSLHSQNKRKEATEVQYRDFKFFTENLTTNENDIPEPPVEESVNENKRELMFDNGVYNGDVVEGKMHGEGSFIFNTGTRYIGSFKNNKMEGKGKLTCINGKVYEGNFINNVLDGPGACKWENGDFYAGEFKNGKMHGKGCYIWGNGNRFEGIFEDNRRTEQGILYKKSELESEAPPEWVNELFK